MKQWDSVLISAFDSVHADAAQKRSAEAFVRAEREKRGRSSLLCSFRRAASLAGITLVFFSGYLFRMYFEPVSVISIDINPSLELSVNTYDRVVRVDGFNEDGRELAEGLQLRFLNYEEAVDRIVNSETVTTLLNREEELVITVVGEDENRNAKLCESLESYTQSRGSGSCYTALPETVEDAHSCGMSYGKYLAYQQALQQDENLTSEEVQDMTMNEIREITEDTCHTQPLCEETKNPLVSAQQHHGHKGKQHHNGHH